LKAGEDGIYRSEIFPGLWLDVNALLDGDMRQVLDMLNAELQSAEHAAFTVSLT
jgi:hypothetical protein